MNESDKVSAVISSESTSVFELVEDDSRLWALEEVRLTCPACLFSLSSDWH